MPLILKPRNGLESGETYSFQVYCSYGVGIWSDTIWVTMPEPPNEDPPGIPGDFYGQIIESSITFSWSEPSYVGGLPIDYYVLYMDDVAIANITSTSTTLSFARDNTEHEYYVRAHNPYGLGDSSAIQFLTISRVASAPYDLVAEVGDGEIYLSWTEPLEVGTGIQYYMVYGMEICTTR